MLYLYFCSFFLIQSHLLSINNLGIPKNLMYVQKGHSFKFNKKLIIFVYFISKEKRIVIQVRYNLLSNNFVYYTLYINIIEPKGKLIQKVNIFLRFYIRMV